MGSLWEIKNYLLVSTSLLSRFYSTTRLRHFQRYIVVLCRSKGCKVTSCQFGGLKKILLSSPSRIIRMQSWDQVPDDLIILKFFGFDKKYFVHDELEIVQIKGWGIRMRKISFCKHNADKYFISKLIIFQIWKKCKLQVSKVLLFCFSYDHLTEKTSSGLLTHPVLLCELFGWEYKFHELVEKHIKTYLGHR